MKTPSEMYLWRRNCLLNFESYPTPDPWALDLDWICRGARFIPTRSIPTSVIPTHAVPTSLIPTPRRIYASQRKGREGEGGKGEGEGEKEAGWI